MHHHSKHEDRKSFLAVEALREVMEREDRPISSSPEHPMKNTTPERTAKDYIDAFLDLDPQDDKSRMSALGGLFILAIEQGRQAGLARGFDEGYRASSTDQATYEQRGMNKTTENPYHTSNTTQEP